MKMLKNLAAMGLVSVMMAGALTGCGSSADTGSAASNTQKTSDKKITVGVSLGTLKQERWAREADMFKKWADENDNIEVSIQSANDDTALQVSQCENLLNTGIDVLIIQPLDGSTVTPVIDACHDEGVPVISYDRMATGCDVDYYVTFDSVKVGEIQAQYVIDQAPEGNYIWLLGGPEDQNATLVAEGQTKVLQEYIDSGKINIVAKQWCDGWAPDLALNYTENGLSACNNNLQGIVASDDGTCGGAVEALSAAGLAGKVPCVGQDATLAACQRVAEGTQTCTIFKPTSELNKVACDLAYELATDGNPDDIDIGTGTWTTYDNGYKDLKTVALDVIPVDKDNLYDVVIKQYAYQTLEDVYANVDKSEWPAES